MSCSNASGCSGSKNAKVRSVAGDKAPSTLVGRGEAELTKTKVYKGWGVQSVTGQSQPRHCCLRAAGLEFPKKQCQLRFATEQPPFWCTWLDRRRTARARLPPGAAPGISIQRPGHDQANSGAQRFAMRRWKIGKLQCSSTIPSEPLIFLEMTSSLQTNSSRQEAKTHSPRNHLEARLIEPALVGLDAVLSTVLPAAIFGRR